MHHHHYHRHHHHHHHRHHHFFDWPCYYLFRIFIFILSWKKGKGGKTMWKEEANWMRTSSRRLKILVPTERTGKYFHRFYDLIFSAKRCWAPLVIGYMQNSPSRQALVLFLSEPRPETDIKRDSNTSFSKMLQGMLRNWENNTKSTFTWDCSANFCLSSWNKEKKNRGQHSKLGHTTTEKRKNSQILTCFLQIKQFSNCFYIQNTLRN